MGKICYVTIILRRQDNAVGVIVLVGATPTRVYWSVDVSGVFHAAARFAIYVGGVSSARSCRRFKSRFRPPPPGL